MPSPSPDFIETDPPPLNPTAFPFRVDSLPVQWLAEFGRLIPVTAQGEALARPENPHRFE